MLINKVFKDVIKLIDFFRQLIIIIIIKTRWCEFPMDPKTIYQELIEIAEKIGYEVKESRMSEEISSSGGRIKLKEKRYILLNTRAKIEDRIVSLVETLETENLNRLHISPFIRDKYFKND